MELLSLNAPIGKLTIASDGEHITHIFFDGEEPSNGSESCCSPVLEAAEEQLNEYFAGGRKAFDLPLKPSGGAFHKKVWEIMLEKVPYGSTISYSALASMAGNPKAARAVGMANNRNPIPIIIPCHRVVGKSGNMTGFRPGIDIKEKLLTLEETYIQ